MCLIKTPKIANPTPASASADKPLPVIRNPLLDGYDPTGMLRIGRTNLRTDLPQAAAPTAATAPSLMLRQYG